MTRAMQRARQPTSFNSRTRRGKEGDVFEWRMVEHTPKVCKLQRHGGTMVKEGALPAGELESRDVSSLKRY